MGCMLKGGGGLSSRIAVGAVLLAAGEARRMGGRPKALLELGGVPLIRRNLVALSGAGVDEVAVVLGHRAEEIEPVVCDFPVTLLRHHDYSRGQMSSMHAGVAALSQRLDAVIVAMADQPLLNAQDVIDLISVFKRRGAAAAVVPCVDGQRGNPIVMEGAVRDAVLEGDVNFGCRQWLAANPDRVMRFDSANSHYVVDIDTPADMESFTARYGHVLRWPPGLAA